MRGKNCIAVAVRKPDKQISSIIRPLHKLYSGWARQKPFLRGTIVLIEAMVLGIQTLLYSANVSLEGVSEGEEKVELSGPLIWSILLFSLLFVVAIFFIGPLLLTNLIDPYIHSSILSNIVEGLIRLLLFILYLLAISRLKDIKRVFAYHGAEHKAVNALEAGIELEVDGVDKFSTAHTRCGTSFILSVLVIAIFVFALLGRPEIWLRILSRILLLPVIASLGYEFTRLSAAYPNNFIMRLFIMPGLLLQKLTTRQPDREQLEVAITALKEVIKADEAASTSIS